MKRLFGVLFNTKGLAGVALGFITSLAPSLALADELNSGDTAWMLTAHALVLFMTILVFLFFTAGSSALKMFYRYLCSVLPLPAWPPLFGLPSVTASPSAMVDQ